jgi:hypothetical protein
MTGGETARRGQRLRLNAFSAGVGVGVALPLLGVGLLALTLADLRPPRFNVDVASAGADISRNGGRRIVVANDRGAVVQTCRGRCDDLRLQESSGDNSYRVRILDSAGACIACTPGLYVTNGYGASITRVDVSGRDHLQVRLRDLNRDGTEIVPGQGQSIGEATP